jgi:hypothetical protein
VTVQSRLRHFPGRRSKPLCARCATPAACRCPVKA